MSHQDFADLDIVARYKKNYRISEESPITREMVMQHWDLERRLTIELLGTSEENRFETFERCYTTLYDQLSWLNEYIHETISAAPEVRYRAWADVIGPSPRKIYEIGSGKCTMIAYLSSLGHTCKATEITKARGSKFLAGNSNVELGNTDGINLNQFEDANSYDVLLSDQVIEHFHPDDLLRHFKNAFIILKSGGRYVFSTPHMYLGPHDVSRVLGLPKAMGMHLKEYSFKELSDVAAEAGFKKIRYAYQFSHELDRIGLSMVLRKLGVGHDIQKRAAGSIYYRIVRLSEGIISLLPGVTFKKVLAKALANVHLFSSNIFLEMSKP